ncbi:acyltransferase family protein [Novacetimonas hansenii]|uniref:acyltransferase family protein n=1 Tax=Novacetimonas hansenii TaxID=436 RepID=UPI0009501F41|nr:acyltransferase [Novacetimonas hansenii]
MDAPRHHYAALDGVRGFAALSVMIYHLGHWLDVPQLAVNSGLAVDLFFCLSGYVLSLSYDTRMTGSRGLSMGQFFSRRLVRLMPVVVVATVLGGAYVILRAYLNGGDVPYAALCVALVLALLDLPYLFAPHEIGGPQVFPLNGPQYSLFLELFINLLWWMTRRLDQRLLAVAMVGVCLPLVWVTGLGGDVPATFWSGFPRVGASFFMGVALYRFAQVIPAAISGVSMFMTCFCLMLVLFFWPGVASRGVEMAWIAIFSPLLVISGARIRMPAALTRLSLLGGEVSYPLYALHYPVFCWVNGLFQAMVHARVAIVEIPLVFVMAIMVSVFVLKKVDEPVRRMLSHRSPPNAPGGRSYPVVGEASAVMPVHNER